MGPLEGIRVVDFSRLAPGPYCGMLLADMGADVVRVDRAPVASADRNPFGDVLGRGKRSICIDLKKPAGVDVALRLVEWADVLVEGFRPGVMERLGLGPDVALGRNPRLVYARVTGWGQTGPLAQRAGHDINYIAVSGALGAVGRKGEPPVPPVNLVGDFAGGGLFTAFGIACALVRRSTTDEGEVIDGAMVDGAANLMSFFAGALENGMWGDRGTNLIDTGAHFYECYETSDGGFMSVGAIEPQFYSELVDGLGLADADLPDQMDMSSWPDLKKRFAEVFRTKTRDEWTEIFEHRDACCYPVLDPAEARTHRYNTERDTYVRDAAGLLQPAPGPRFSRSEGTIRGAGPDPGAHTKEVLDELGYAASDIDGLNEAGAVDGI